MSDTLTAGLDLDYRPDTYWPEGETASGSSGRKHTQYDDIITGGGAVGALARIGQLTGAQEYLPESEPEEVEIVRVLLASTTFDVISVRARREDGEIHYSIVDEYDTELILPTTSSKQPLTFAEVIELIDECEYVEDGGFGSGLFDPTWASNLQYEPDAVEEIAAFIQVESAFYPELATWFERKQAAFVAEHTDEDDLDGDDDEA